ncbi:MAG TPA: Flp family type IVb pilin [Nevskiales bacterium]|nr:Flp family type IVb pilin [Nevskiales bacterium]
MTTQTKRGMQNRGLRSQRGASAVEYGLIIALIAVAIILTVTALGGGLDGLFQQVLDALPGGG